MIIFISKLCKNKSCSNADPRAHNQKVIHSLSSCVGLKRFEYPIAIQFILVCHIIMSDGQKRGAAVV